MSLTKVDWILLGTLALSFHVEEWGKELWLVKHDGPIVDGPCENGKNIPFRPHILCAKAEPKTAVEVFSQAAERWQPSAC